MSKEKVVVEYIESSCVYRISVTKEFLWFFKSVRVFEGNTDSWTEGSSTVTDKHEIVYLNATLRTSSAFLKQRSAKTKSKFAAATSKSKQAGYSSGQSDSHVFDISSSPVDWFANTSVASGRSNVCTNDSTTSDSSQSCTTSD